MFKVDCQIYCENYTTLLSGYKEQVNKLSKEVFLRKEKKKKWEKSPTHVDSRQSIRKGPI